MQGYQGYKWEMCAGAARIPGSIRHRQEWDQYVGLEIKLPGDECGSFKINHVGVILYPYVGMEGI